MYYSILKLLIWLEIFKNTDIDIYIKFWNLSLEKNKLKGDTN